MTKNGDNNVDDMVEVNDMYIESIKNKLDLLEDYSWDCLQSYFK